MHSALRVRAATVLALVFILVSSLEGAAGQGMETPGQVCDDPLSGGAVVIGKGQHVGQGAYMQTDFETYLVETFKALGYSNAQMVFCNATSDFTWLGSEHTVALADITGCPYRQLVNSTATIISTSGPNSQRLGMTLFNGATPDCVQFDAVGFILGALRLPAYSFSAMQAQGGFDYVAGEGACIPGVRQSNMDGNAYIIGVWPMGVPMSGNNIAMGPRMHLGIFPQAANVGAFTKEFCNCIYLTFTWAITRTSATIVRNLLPTYNYPSYNAAPISLFLSYRWGGMGSSPIPHNVTLSYRIVSVGNTSDLSFIARPTTDYVFSTFPQNLRFGVNAPGRCGDIWLIIFCNGDTSSVYPGTSPFICQPFNRVRITVADVPDPPVIHEPTVYSGSVIINFDRPAFSCLPLLYCSINYIVLPGGAPQSLLYLPTYSGQEHATVSLTPGLTYAMSVTARNGQGFSNASAVVIVTLPPGCPTITALTYSPVSDCGFPAPANTSCTIACPLKYFGTPVQKFCQLDATWTPDASPPTCQACDGSCSTCGGPAASDCLTCPDGRFLSQGYCPSCATNCVACTGVLSADCIQCTPGYYLVEGIGCRPCDASCATCNTTSYDCVTCPTGALLTRQHNCTGCVSPCATCSVVPDNCESCVGGYYQDYSDCLACPVECTGCLSATNCTSCTDGLLLVDGACVGCDASCASCSGPSALECLSCGPALFLVAGACAACPASGCAQPDAITAAPIPLGLTVPIIGGAAGALALCSLVVAFLLVRRSRARANAGGADKRKSRPGSKGAELHTGDTTVKLEEMGAPNPMFDEANIEGTPDTILMSGAPLFSNGSSVQNLSSTASSATGSQGSIVNPQQQRMSRPPPATPGNEHTSLHHTTIVLASGGGAAGSRASEKVSFTIDQGAIKEVPWGDLTILAELGAGSIATVYHVRENNSYTEMVVKVYNKLTTPEQVELLAKRAKLWSAVHHTHCVPCYGLTQDPGSGCVGLLTKHMPRGSLGSLVKLLGVNDKVSVLRDACKGLAYVHGSRLVHGSLSPNKILLDAYGVAAVGDLANVGAPNAAFAAPEVLAGEEATAASDLYAFGLTALHVLSGESPEALRIAKQPPRVKGVSKDTIKALMRCLDPVPAKRGVVGGLADAIIGGADD